MKLEVNTHELMVKYQQQGFERKISQYEMMDPNTKKYKTIKQVICPKCKTIIDI